MLEKFKEELIKAMKDKDKIKLNTLRSVKGAMQLEVINNKKEENDDLLITVVNKQIKMRKDSISEFTKGNRMDLVSSYEKEIKILEEYMPKMLTLDEINEIIESGISKTGASSIKDLGLVMREITPLLKNKCDMKSVTNMIKEKLN
ncbi:MAG: GatB/YqeY domain-containing protein [bacterium]|nr:GatB/YqeY domain-containing protein [bacterium]